VVFLFRDDGRVGENRLILFIFSCVCVGEGGTVIPFMGQGCFYASELWWGLVA